MTPKHEAGDPTAFTNQVQAAAEHLLAVVDGKPKEAFGGTYNQIKEVIGKVHESGYLDQVQENLLYEENAEAEVTAPHTQEVIINHEVLPAQTQEVLPPLETLTIEPRNQIPPPLVEQPQMPPEQIYFQPPQPQPPQPPRPISEVLGGSSFYFLQVIII